MDPTAQERKKDHIDLAFKSVPEGSTLDTRFHYEPMLSGHPKADCLQQEFLGVRFGAPIWISSMTGGTEKAKLINKNLAKAANEFGMGMGLGSCRQLLHSNERLADFTVRDEIGDRPLYANLGIAQVQELIKNNQLNLVGELLKRLQADGLIVHINPLQEWFQPEGDRYFISPLDTIKELIDKLDISIIVKEVGQGMGYESLKSLLHLPISAIEFAALGGTNFTKLEMYRDQGFDMDGDQAAFITVGHTATEMTRLVNKIMAQSDKVECKEIIISGGIKNFMDGYYLTSLCECNAIYGQASGFLKHALGSYDTLHEYVLNQINGLKLAKTFLRIKK